MAKKLDLKRTVFELIEEYPELAELMAKLGFSEVTKTAMLHSVGKLTTIPKGARMKQIPMEDVIRTLTEQGFEVEGAEASEPMTETAETRPTAVSSGSRTEQLKAYLRRLGDGEDLEQVRADFVRAFSEVEAFEIMQAEQELLQEGTPLSEVQKLCDVHSALFHGATREEKIANAEKAVEDALRRQASFPKKDYSPCLGTVELMQDMEFAKEHFCR